MKRIFIFILLFLINHVYCEHTKTGKVLIYADNSEYGNLNFSNIRINQDRIFKFYEGDIELLSLDGSNEFTKKSIPIGDHILTKVDIYNTSGRIIFWKSYPLSGILSVSSDNPVIFPYKIYYNKITENTYNVEIRDITDYDYDVCLDHLGLVQKTDQIIPDNLQNYYFPQVNNNKTFKYLVTQVIGNDISVEIKYHNDGDHYLVSENTIFNKRYTNTCLHNYSIINNLLIHNETEETYRMINKNIWQTVKYLNETPTKYNAIVTYSEMPDVTERLTRNNTSISLKTITVFKQPHKCIEIKEHIYDEISTDGNTTPIGDFYIYKYYALNIGFVRLISSQNNHIVRQELVEITED